MLVSYTRVSSANQAVMEAWQAMEKAYEARQVLLYELLSELDGSLLPEDAFYLNDMRASLSEYNQSDSHDVRVRSAGEAESIYTSLLFMIEENRVLRADRDIQRLVSAIAQTEANVSQARSAYNNAVRDYNRISEGIRGREAKIYFYSADGI